MSRVYLVRHCQAAGQEPLAPLTDAGRSQAETLARTWTDVGVSRIISSPYSRAVDSVLPLAERLNLPVEEDERLMERVLSTEPLPDWRDHLRRSFVDPDYGLPSGESGRVATQRGLGCVQEVMADQNVNAVIVTHGNLLALILNHFDPTFGFDAWERLINPDIYRLDFTEATTQIRRIEIGVND